MLGNNYQNYHRDELFSVSKPDSKIRLGSITVHIFMERNQENTEFNDVFLINKGEHIVIRLGLNKPVQRYDWNDEMRRYEVHGGLRTCVPGVIIQEINSEKGRTT